VQCGFGLFYVDWVDFIDSIFSQNAFYDGSSHEIVYYNNCNMFEEMFIYSEMFEERDIHSFQML